MVATPPPPVEGDDAKKDGRPMGETVGLVFNVVGLLMGCLIARPPARVSKRVGAGSRRLGTSARPPQTITGLLQLIWASGWGDAQKALLGLYMIGFGLFAIILEVMEVKILIARRGVGSFATIFATTPRKRSLRPPLARRENDT